MIEFEIFYDPDSDRRGGSPVALRYAGQKVLIASVDVSVPIRSRTGGKPRMVMVGTANAIEIEKGKAIIK